MIDHPIVRIGLLLKKVEAIETRKKFQKLVHILQVMGAPFPETYDFHHYGAYSSELRGELDAFKAEDLIDETEIPGQFVSFTVKPTAKLLGLLDKLQITDEPEWLRWAAELNRESPGVLEGVSTLLYLHQRLWPQASWRGKFTELKPHLAGGYDRFERKALGLLETASQSAA